MPRRRDPDTLDMIGFDPVGADFMVSADERRALLGLGPLCMALYYSALKPFAKGDGRVYAQSYYRLSQILMCRAEPGTGGPKPAEPSKKQLRSAIDRLETWGLVKRSGAFNEQRGVLQIWLVHGVGGTSAKSKRAGVRAGSKTAAARANASDQPELSTEQGRG